MIIGLTGKNASGKGEVATLLQENGFIYYSLSDVLREELQKKGMKDIRENLIQVGNELRQKGGAGILAEKILQKIDLDKNYVIDSIRNPEEVHVLRRLSNFKLLYVSSSSELRFERIKRRNRPGDPKTLSEFKKFEEKEIKSDDPCAQQLEATACLKDAEIKNNGSLEEMKAAVNPLLLNLLKEQSRPSWDEYFMDIARTVSLRSNCLKRKVAAVLVKDKRIISTGYNGTPRGVTNCNEGGCPRCGSLGGSGKNLEECFCSHAEENSITQAAYHGVSVGGSSLYTTFSPCLICTKMIINSGVSEVIYNAAYPLGEKPLELLREAGIQVRQYRR